MVEVHGVVEALVTGLHRVTLTVRDYGRWRLTLTRDEHGHRGISIMQACMDTVAIGPPNDGRPGTRVVLGSKNVLVPALGVPANNGDNQSQ